MAHWGRITPSLMQAHTVYTPISQHSALQNTHSCTHALMSKRKCSRRGGGIMLDMWSRSCLVLVIPKPRGLSLAAAWICILSLSRAFCLYPLSPLFLFVWLPLFYETGGKILKNKAGNKPTVGVKWERRITLKEGLAVNVLLSFSNILPLLLLL